METVKLRKVCISKKTSVAIDVYVEADNEQEAIEEAQQGMSDSKWCGKDWKPLPVIDDSEYYDDQDVMIEVLKFKDEKEFEEYLRSIMVKEKFIIPEIVIVNNILFTQDWCDRLGKELSYGNKIKEASMYLHTKNRYSKLAHERANLNVVIYHGNTVFIKDINYLE